MKYGICTLDDFDLKGKTVLCRVDINQPVDRKTGTLRDTTRIRGCVSTIRELSDNKAKVVLLAHQGGDLEYKNYYTTEPHAKLLAEYLDRPVKFIDDVTGPCARDMIASLGEGEILLLDNVRFVSEEMTLFETRLKLSAEEQSRTQVVSKLAPLADLYVCDAFAAAHRSQPSLVGFEQVLPSAMGRLFEREFTVISNVMENPERPCLFILGGAKIQDAFLMMGAVLSGGVADKVITGGLVSQIMFLAKGVSLGAESEEFIEKNNLMEYATTARELLVRYEDRILLPVDLAYFDETRREIDVKDLPVEGMLADIGHKTAEVYKKAIGEAKTVFINGPMGVFENEATEHGTKTIWQAVADSSAFSVLGGGDSITAANKYQVKDKISYICTGGGALVRFLSGEELPVVKALRNAAVKFHADRR
jgi:phosphoglycerate kinase